MGDPFCTIHWPWEGYREVRVYNLAGLLGDPVQSTCRALADAARDATNVEELRKALDGVCDGLGLRIGQFRAEPDHSDPLGDLVTMTLYRRA